MQKQVNTFDAVTENEEPSLGDIFYKFFPYWPYFLLLVIIALGGAWLYLRYKMPIYQTTATILIKEDKKGAQASDLLEALDMFGSKKTVENEVEVLKSKTLMQDVVRRLGLYAPVTVEGRVAAKSAYVASPIKVEARNPDSIHISPRISFNFNSQNVSVKIGDSIYPLNQWVTTGYGILKFMPNKYFQSGKINPKDHFYFSLNSIKNTANNLLRAVNISSSSKESTVIDLSMESEVPAEGEDILNELLKVYNEAAILDKNVLAANTLKFVEDRLKYVVNELDSVEGKLQHFKTSNKITDISTQGQMYLQTVATNDQKLSDLNVQLAVLDQVEKYVKSNGDVGGIAPATLGVDDPTLANLLEKLSDLELKYTQTKKIVPENNPALIAIVDGVDKLKPEILDNVQQQRKNLLAAKTNLEGTNNQYASMLTTIPEKERELLSISRQQAIKNNIYTYLLQKREETALSYASAVADSRIIDRAQTSDTPVSPNKKLVYLAAFLGALFVGGGAVYIKDILTRTVQDRNEVEKYTDVPFLGEVSFERSDSAIVIGEGQRSFIAEQFRQLRTSLGYLGVDDGHKKILVTSSISGEGKSFIAINLGISLGLTGKKVVLIELDLRKPKLSEQFGISRSSGLSNYLIGKASPDDLVKQTNIGNIYLIPSGPIPPNPSELISNGKLPELLAYLEDRFDYIFMDTAPVNPVTDAFLLSPLANVTLFIVRHDYTPKLFIKNLEKQHKIDALKNPAIIYNGVKGRGIQKYGYGYGYGYGYTEETGKKWWNIFRR